MSNGLPLRGTPFTRRLGVRMLRLCGWRIAGALPDLPRFVVIVAPHTSNWDFPFAILAMIGTGLRCTWFGKHTLFRFPLVGLLRWLGGEPVVRSAARGTVRTAIENFRSRAQWVLTLSPEGTRKRVAQWKTGFLRIAAAAGVPIVPVWLDYPAREVGIGAPITPPDDSPESLAAIRALFRPDMAKHPEQFAANP